VSLEIEREELRLAAIDFLTAFKRTAGDDLATLWGDLSADDVESGVPFDPAAWYDWVRSSWRVRGVALAPPTDESKTVQDGRNVVQTRDGTVFEVFVADCALPVWVGSAPPQLAGIKLEEVATFAFLRRLVADAALREGMSVSMLLRELEAPSPWEVPWWQPAEEFAIDVQRRIGTKEWLCPR
jgi:hypothetical protein